jgi:hypothetical protein
MCSCVELIDTSCDRNMSVMEFLVNKLWVEYVDLMEFLSNKLWGMT